jgi:hypothetical protein
MSGSHLSSYRHLCVKVKLSPMECKACCIVLAFKAQIIHLRASSMSNTVYYKDRASRIIWHVQNVIRNRIQQLVYEFDKNSHMYY